MHVNWGCYYIVADKTVRKNIPQHMKNIRCRLYWKIPADAWVRNNDRLYKRLWGTMRRFYSV